MKQLRLTTTQPMPFAGVFNSNPEDHKPLVEVEDAGELIRTEIKGKNAYIHGQAERLAGYDIPTFIDGDLGQLDLPVDQQDIILILPKGEYKCKAEYCDKPLSSDCYLITLKGEESVAG